MDQITKIEQRLKNFINVKFTKIDNYTTTIKQSIPRKYTLKYLQRKEHVCNLLSVQKKKCLCVQVHMYRREGERGQ